MIALDLIVSHLCAHVGHLAASAARTVGAMPLHTLFPSAWAWAAPKLRSVLQPAGLVLLAAAAGFALHSWNYARQQIRVIGVVTENVATFGARGGVLYTPRVRFRTADGTTLQLVLGPAGDGAAFLPGASVPILYPSNRPNAAEIATPGRLYAAAIWFGVCGIVLLDAGLILRRLARPQTSSE